MSDTKDQPDFFDDGSTGLELARLDEPEVRKQYTGEKLEERVAVRDAVVRGLAAGVGILRIARILRKQGVKIGEHSIMALRDNRPDLVAIEKKQMSTQLGRIGKLMADSIEERLVSGIMNPGSVDLAIVIDKKLALDGEANLVIEHRHTLGAGAEDYARRIEEMKRAKVAQAPAIDVVSTDLPQKPQ